MSAPVVAAPSALNGALLAVSTPSQMAFLTGLPQLGSAEPLWVLGPGVPANAAAGTVEKVDRQFGKPRSLLASKAEARALIEAEEPQVVLVAAGPLALPFLLAARDLEIATIYFESPDATSRGRSLVSRLADRVVVEWEHQLTRHPFATVLGETL